MAALSRRYFDRNGRAASIDNRIDFCRSAASRATDCLSIRPAFYSVPRSVSLGGRAVDHKVVRFSLFWKVSPVLVLLQLLIGLFIPMGSGAPQGTARTVSNSVAIVPVAGEVVGVPVTANTLLKADDVLAISGVGLKTEPVLRSGENFDEAVRRASVAKARFEF